MPVVPSHAWQGPYRKTKSPLIRPCGAPSPASGRRDKAKSQKPKAKSQKPKAKSTPPQPSPCLRQREGEHRSLQALEQLPSACSAPLPEAKEGRTPGAAGIGTAAKCKLDPLPLPQARGGLGRGAFASASVSVFVLASTLADCPALASAATSNSKQQQQATTASNNSKQQQQATTASNNSKQQQQATTSLTPPAAPLQPHPQPNNGIPKPPPPTHQPAAPSSVPRHWLLPPTPRSAGWFRPSARRYG